MVKFTILLERRADLTHAEFVTHHRTVHAPLWFDAAVGIAAVSTDAEYLARIRPDEARFLDLHGCDFLVSEETVVGG